MNSSSQNECLIIFGYNQLQPAGAPSGRMCLSVSPSISDLKLPVGYSVINEF